MALLVVYGKFDKQIANLELGNAANKFSRSHAGSRIFHVPFHYPSYGTVADLECDLDLNIFSKSQQDRLCLASRLDDLLVNSQKSLIIYYSVYVLCSNLSRKWYLRLVGHEG